MEMIKAKKVYYLHDVDVAVEAASSSSHFAERSEPISMYIWPVAVRIRMTRHRSLLSLLWMCLQLVA